MVRRHLGIRTLLAAAFLLFILAKPKAQDMIFSQYYFSPVHINPAFAGIARYPTFTTNYRLQWPGFSSAYKTYALTYDQFFKRINSGIGFTALADDQGDGTIKTTRITGIYSYNVRFRQDWQIKFGLEVGFSQSRLDWDKLIFFDQINPASGPFDGAGIPNPSSEVRPADLSNGYLDVNFGMLLYNPLFYVGFSLDHVNAPYNGFIPANEIQGRQLPVVFKLNGGMQIILEKDNKGKPLAFISPNILFAHQSGFNQINVGAYMQIKQLFGGVWLRHTLSNVDAAIFSVGVDLDTLRLGYSFDLTTSNIGIDSGGSHEIGITFRLKNLEKKESKYNDCFSLFR